jgi:hypothetical protein
MTHKTHPDGVFQLPEAFLLATHRYIIVRECYATMFNPAATDAPITYQVGDVCLHASFVWETPNQYCCLVNSQMMHKKCFEVLGVATEFKIEFRTIDGLRAPVDSYLFDFLCRWQNN